MWTIALSLAIGYGLGLGLVEVFDLFENEDDTEAAETVATEADTDMLDDINIVEPPVEPTETVVEESSDTASENIVEATPENVVAVEETAPPLVLKQPLAFDDAELLSPDTLSNGDFNVETDVLLVAPIAGSDNATTAQLIEDAESQTTDLVLSNADTQNATMTIYATGLTWDNVSFRDWGTAPDMLTKT